MRGESAEHEGNGAGLRYVEHAVQISKETTDKLQAEARLLQVTLNTLVQGAWALLLRHHSGNKDVVFGAAFAGRADGPPRRRIDRRAFVNNLPVRVAFDDGLTVSSFFRELHASLLQISAHQFTPLMEIQRSSEVPWRYRLFDSLIVFQNYAIDESARRFGHDAEIRDFAGPIHTNYPVMLLANPESTLRLTLIYDRRSVAATSAERWSRDLASLLHDIPVSADRSITELSTILSSPVAADTRHKQQLSVQSQNYVPPQSELEHKIADVWKVIWLRSDQC